MRKYLMLLVLPLALLGCGVIHKHPATNPQQVIDQSALSASQLCKTVSIGLQAVDAGIDTVKGDDPEYYIAVKAWLIKIAQANDKAIVVVGMIEKGNTNLSVKASMMNIATEAASFDPSTFNVKNPKSKQTFLLVSATLKAVITTITTSFGGPNG